MRIERRRSGWLRWWAVGFVLAGASCIGGGWVASADAPPPPPVAPAPAPMAPPAPAIAPDGAAGKPELLTLDKAVASGLVEVRGTRPSSYEQVDLVLTSKADQPLRLDLAGRHLKPTTSGCQRLGLSHPVTPGDRPPDAMAGTWPIELAPKQVRTVRMHTCCLDSGRSCPNGSDRFQLGDAATPPAVELALRWWTDHPRAAQGFVNRAIWSNDVRLLDKPYETVAPGSETPTPIGPKGRKIRSYAGIVYTLVDGALTSVDSDGVRRFHGTQIYDVLPRADALYGIGESPTTGYDLWRFAPTGEPPWGRVFAVDDWTKLSEFLPVVGGAFLTRTDDDALHWRASKSVEPVTVIAAPKASRFSVGPADASKGRFVAVIHMTGTPKAGTESQGLGALSASAAKFAVYDVDGKTGSTEIRKVFWNARDMVAGPGGVFSLSPVGTPEKLDGEKLRRLASAEEFSSIVLVGLAHLVVKTKDGALVAYDVKSGKTSPLPASAHAEAISIDPVTDDVVWVGEHDFLRWRFGATDAEIVP